MRKGKRGQTWEEGKWAVRGGGERGGKERTGKQGKQGERPPNANRTIHMTLGSPSPLVVNSRVTARRTPLCFEGVYDSRLPGPGARELGAAP